MKQIWQGRMIQAAGRYGDLAPTTAVCCNACRACATTNVVALLTAGLTAVSVPAARFAQRLVTRT